MAVATLCNSHKPIGTAWHLKHTVFIIDSNEEQLISEPKGEVLEEWRGKCRLKPTHKLAASHSLNVRSCGIPAVCEFFGEFSHMDVVHSSDSSKWIFWVFVEDSSQTGCRAAHPCASVRAETAHLSED
jgi:hypothetical protein